MRFLFIFFIELFSIFTVCSQTVDSSKVFLTRYKSCELLIDSKKDKAITCFENLNKDFPKKIKTLTKLAKLYYEKKEETLCLQNANEAIDINANEAFEPLNILINKMNVANDYALGVKILNRLSVQISDSSKLNKIEKNKMKFVLSTNKTILNVPGINLKNLGDSINTKENEYLPTTSLDGKQLVFTRNVGGNEDFFVSTIDSNLKWSKAQNMGYPPNTGLPDGAAMLSADGYYLFYTRCDMKSPNGIEGGGCDLVFSYKEDSIWSSPQYFGYTINTTAYEGQPCISSDNVDLYFVSNREGGYGGKDIWVSHYINDLWTKPENLGPYINTAKDETSPFIHPDNETLYFSSNGHLGIGSSDLFVSRKNKNGTWKPPINLGAPINTVGFDGSIYISAKGNKGFCASDRGDTKGGLDIYSFNTYNAIQPVPTICIKGYVIDKYTKKKIYGTPIQVKNITNQTELKETRSNTGDASYVYALQMGKKYTFFIEEAGYKSLYKTITIVDSFPENFYYNFKLKEPGITDTLFKATITLDSTKTKLDSASMVLIDSIKKEWKQWTEDSSTVTILLNGYYYSGDSSLDERFRNNILKCEENINYVQSLFSKQKLQCHQMQYDMDMLIYKDDEEIFDTIDIIVVENY